VFVRGQGVQDLLRVERIAALGRLGAHDVIVTSQRWHRRDTPCGRPWGIGASENKRRAAWRMRRTSP
jgi:hypothetical protein